jgi:hypothetical protein
MPRQRHVKPIKKLNLLKYINKYTYIFLKKIKIQTKIKKQKTRGGLATPCLWGWPRATPMATGGSAQPPPMAWGGLRATPRPTRGGHAPPSATFGGGRDLPNGWGWPSGHPWIY